VVKPDLGALPVALATKVNQPPMNADKTFLNGRSSAFIGGSLFLEYFSMLPA
jgi:hypothetical protein